MIGRLLFAAAAWLGSQVQAPPPVGAPMQPSGPWVAGSDKQKCILSRTYGAGRSGFELAFLSLPAQETFEVALIMPRQAAGPAGPGLVTLTLSPSGQHVKATAAEYEASRGMRQIRFTVRSNELGDLESATSLRLTVDGISLNFALAAVAKARGAIANCEDNLARQWGFDPAALRGLVERPAPLDPQSWVWRGNFLTEVLLAVETGKLGFRITVDPAGKVSNCTVVTGGGSRDLDIAACELIQRSARFRPAKARDGRSVPAPWFGKFGGRVRD